MSLNLICIDCRIVLRSAEHMRRGRCDSCYQTHTEQRAAAKEAADQAAYLATEVHEVCTGCGTPVQGHRAKTDGLCAVCMDKRSRLHKKAREMYMGDDESMTQKCPTCGADYGKHCVDGNGSGAHFADSAHTARKVAVLDWRKRNEERHAKEREAIATLGDWRTIDGCVIFLGLPVWNYNLDQDRVVALDHVVDYAVKGVPNGERNAWWRTTKGCFDSDRMWVHHPVTGKRCGA